MISLVVVFGMFVIAAAIIGAMRGQKKEVLVAVSVILALFLISLLESASFVSDLFKNKSTGQFWMRTAILIGLTIFGYQTPNLGTLAGRTKRGKAIDVLLGLLFGALNGYLVVGTLWYFLDYTGYVFDYVTKPNADTSAGKLAVELIKVLPPALLKGKLMYAAVGLAFVFVIVVIV